MSIAATIHLTSFRLWREEAEPYDGETVALSGSDFGLMAVDAARAIGIMPWFGFPLLPQSYDGSETPGPQAAARRHIY